MTKREYIKVAFFIVWRSFQSLVVIPASLAGAVILLLILMGNSPIQETLIAVHQWAETAVRPAPPGTVLVADCKTPATREIKPPVLCDSTKEMAVPIADAARGASKQLATIYLVLALLSFGGLVMALPGRQFFGIQQPAQA